MGLVLVTVEAFQEKRVSEEICSLLMLRNVYTNYRTFEKYPGIILLESNLDSIVTSRIMLSIAHVRRVVKSVVPLVWVRFNKFRSYEDVIVQVIEDLLPRIDIDKLNSERVAIRCRFRGIRGEHRAEMIIGAYLRRIVNLKISLENPTYLILIEQVGELCGAYVGHPDKSILVYRPYVY